MWTFLKFHPLVCSCIPPQIFFCTSAWKISNLYHPVCISPNSAITGWIPLTYNKSIKFLSGFCFIYSAVLQNTTFLYNSKMTFPFLDSLILNQQHLIINIQIKKCEINKNVNVIGKILNEMSM